MKAYQESVAEAVEASRRTEGEYLSSGYPKGVGEYVSITGRRYLFEEYESPEFMQKRAIYASFSPTQMKNYPIQGFATGDIVPHMLGELHTMLAKADPLWEGCLPINTVHDSIILDLHEDMLVSAPHIIKSVLEGAPVYMRDHFGVEIDLPLKVDIEYGPNWEEMKQWKP